MTEQKYLKYINQGEKENNILNNYLLKKYSDKVKQWDKISISNNNNKMGDIASFSLPPVLTCKNCGHCKKQCYAINHIYKLYKNAEQSYDRNLYLLINNYNLVYAQLNNFLKRVRVFRFNVSGDIYNLQYLNLIINLARDNKHCKILIFTKNYKLINDLYFIIKKINNLQIIFSKWGNDTIPINPHNLPISDIIFKNDFIQANENTFICGNNCFNCFLNSCGCFNLKKNEKVLFHIH